MSEWKKCRKRPVVVSFRKVRDITTHTEGEEFSIHDVRHGEWIDTPEGRLWADIERDYIMRGIYGELYPIKKKIFELTYIIIDEWESDEWEPDESQIMTIKDSLRKAKENKNV